LPVSRRQLMAMLRRRERLKVDFKIYLPLSTNEQKIEFAKDLSAMANTLGGIGYLIVGVDDRGKVIGVRPDHISEARLQQINAARCDPPVNFDVNSLDLTSKRVVIIEIPRSLTGPHQVIGIGAFYIRRGPTTDVASTSEVTRMILRRIEIERGKRSEYDRYGPGARVEIMRKDTFAVVRQMGFKRGWIKIVYSDGYSGLTRERKVAFADGLIGGVRTRLYFLFFIRRMNRQRLRDTYYLIEKGWLNLLDRHRINLTKAHLFLLFAEGTVSKGPIEEWSLREPCTVSVFEPSLIYAGLGKGIRVNDVDFEEHRYDLTRALPRFFIQKTKSADNIELKLACVRDWLTENDDILRSIIKFQKAISRTPPFGPHIY